MVSNDCTVSPADAAAERSVRFSVTTLTRTVPPTAPVEPLPIDESAPDGTALTPDASGTPQEATLSAIEKCEGRLHSKRITKALSGLTDPPPARSGRF
ncbi:hypothetical protein [Streptomyces sp. GbtcB6]|uniref:hypothetical protein n=1 Tax=Streptomyces sp. GbtcB6 TaxID=2824751 RepID=UPI0020C6B24C|nr:hypothetical protein [Streptomyces sp. GbtcB6]